MALRFVVEGTVYMLAAREAVALARALRLRAMRRPVPDDALAAAVMLEAALEVPRAAAIMFTEREAAQGVRAPRGPRPRAPLRAPRGEPPPARRGPQPAPIPPQRGCSVLGGRG